MSLDAERLAAANPYPGLRSFEPEESDRFFGRQQQIATLVERLAQVPLIAVAGASGCGKSSLVKAGLINELKRRHEIDDETEWRTLVMKPGNQPIKNLAAALTTALASVPAEVGAGLVDADGLDPLQRRSASLCGQLRLGERALVEVVRLAKLPAGTRVLVVVDQFEEIFRFKRLADPEEASAFVKLLLQAASDSGSGVSVVLTLRSDTLGGCADFPGLPEMVSAGGYLVPRLSRTQRKQAIIGPAELRGAQIAPRLVQRLLTDVSDDFDDLPVMQHALSRTWRHWAEACSGSRAIDLEDYQAIGGGSGALSKHADEVCASLGPLGAAGGTVERVFRALTERLAGGIEVRRPVELGELCAICGDGTAQANADVVRVVERYRRSDTAFLLPASNVALGHDSVIDISHESLIRNWTKLRGWLDEEAESARIYERLASTAALKAKGEASLYGQPELGVALAWRERHSPNQAWAQRYQGDFVQAMDFLDDSQEQELATEAARSRRKRISGTALAAAFLVLLVGTLGWVGNEVSLSTEAKRKQDNMEFLDKMYYAYKQRNSDSAAKPEYCNPSLSPQNTNWQKKMFKQVCYGEDADYQEALGNKLAVLHMINAGKIDDVISEDTKINISKLKGKDAVRAFLNLQSVADMQPMEMRSESRKLINLKASHAEGQDPYCELPKEEKKRSFTHPVHREIANVLCACGKWSLNQKRLVATYENRLSETNKQQDLIIERLNKLTEQQNSSAANKGQETPQSECLTKTDYNAMKGEIEPFNLADDEEPKPLPTDAEWIYWRVAKNASRPESKFAALWNEVGDTVLTYGWALLVLLLSPAWWLWRRWRRHRGAMFPTQPSLLRRTAATIIDGSICFGIMFLPVFAESVPVIVAILAALAYLLFRDAIRFKYSRSIGKILFELRPVRNVADDRGAISLGTSAKRNAPFIVWAILAPFLVGWEMLFIIPSLGEQPDETLIGTIAVGLLLLVMLVPLLWYLFKGRRTLGDIWSGTQVIDADSEESLRVELPTRFIQPNPAPTTPM
ncbi:MAG: RDD family protein [Gammaproteobacteria bacterium]|jgi:hypothetical protein